MQQLTTRHRSSPNLYQEQNRSDRAQQQGREFGEHSCGSEGASTHPPFPVRVPHDNVDCVDGREHSEGAQCIRCSEPPVGDQIR